VVANKPGDEVEIDLLHEGKPIHKTVKLGSHPAIAMGGGGVPPLPLGGGAEEQAKRLRQAIEQDLQNMQGLDKGKMEEKMKHLEKRMEFMFRGLGGVDLDDDADDAADAQASSVATIRMIDDEGSVGIETKNGSKHVRVCDKDGKLQWEGPWDTPQDKAAAPKEIRKRIDQLGGGILENDGGGGLQLRIGPKGPDAPAPEDKGK